MSLRLRLFLGLAGLMAVTVAVQWWWVRGLTRDLSTEVDHTVFEVGHSLASIFIHDPNECPEGATCEEEILEDGTVVLRLRSPGSVMAFKSKVTRGTEPEMARIVDVVVAAPKAGDVGPGDRHHDSAGLHWVTYDDTEAEGETSGPRPVKVTRRTFSEDDRNQIVLRLDVTEGGVPESYLTVTEPSGQDARIRIPNEGLNDKLERFRQQMLWGSFGILAAGLLLAGVIAHRVTVPLRRLAGAAREVGDGALGTQVPVAASGEVGEAIHAFNRMSSELETLDRKTRELRARRHLGEIGEISRGLAHTLRNPLNALGLSVEELAAQGGGEGAALAGSARRQIRRIDQSIRSFLALASQGGGVVSEVAPGELVQDVALEALQDARGRVRLDVDAEAPTPALRAVEPELRAVLQALLVNAVEASPEGGEVAIRVREAEEEGRVSIEIDDQGPGLPAEVRERLFTPHLTTKANGSGMGLFLAHRIATTRYGGRLDLADRPGGGTRAVLEIGPRSQELNDE